MLWRLGWLVRVGNPDVVLTEVTRALVVRYGRDSDDHIPEEAGSPCE